MLTPSGRGAVATIGLRGPGAIQAVSACFLPAAGKPLEAFALGSAVFGQFRTAAAAHEELVVGLIGSEVVEIHCHGGSAAANAILEALAQEDCIAIEQAKWVRETETDPIAAAALLALASAGAERTAEILLDQYRGALRRELTAIESHLRQNEIDAARERLSVLISQRELGLHLTQPWKIVLAGRPNTGKSSLMNALVGYERAIVYPQPGTTRDVLTATTALNGWPVELADTAGIREPGDPLEAEGVSRTRAEVLRADLVVLTLDTTAGWGETLYRELVSAAQRLVVVHNKCDLAPPRDDGRPPGIMVSAKSGAGMEALCDALAGVLVPQSPPPGAGVPFTGDHLATLTDVESLLEAGKTVEARQALLRLLASEVLSNESSVRSAEYAAPTTDN